MNHLSTIVRGNSTTAAPKQTERGWPGSDGGLRQKKPEPGHPPTAARTRKTAARTESESEAESRRLRHYYTIILLYYYFTNDFNLLLVVCFNLQLF